MNSFISSISKLNNKLSKFTNGKFLVSFLGTTYGIYHCSLYEAKAKAIIIYDSVKDSEQTYEKFIEVNRRYINISEYEFEEMVDKGISIIRNDIIEMKKEMRTKYAIYSENNNYVTNYMISIVFFNFTFNVLSKIPVFTIPCFTAMLIKNSFEEKY